MLVRDGEQQCERSFSSNHPLEHQIAQPFGQALNLSKGSHTRTLTETHTHAEPDTH